MCMLRIVCYPAPANVSTPWSLLLETERLATVVDNIGRTCARVMKDGHRLPESRDEC